MDIINVVLIAGRYQDKVYTRLVKKLQDKKFQVAVFETAVDAVNENFSLVHADYIIFEPSGLASISDMYKNVDKYIELSEGAATIFLIVDSRRLYKIREEMAHLGVVEVILFQNMNSSLFKAIEIDKKTDVIPF